MPSVITSGDFVSITHDDSCGRHQTEAASNMTSSVPFSSLSLNGSAPAPTASNGFTNTASSGFEDEFLKLSKPQQDVLLLHGPGKRYSLERAQELPELKHDREILVQVLAIGLNPVDWKGPDYGELARSSTKPPQLTERKASVSPHIRGSTAATLLASLSAHLASPRASRAATSSSALRPTTATSARPRTRSTS